MRPIGIVHTPYETRENMPVQPGGATDTSGTVVLRPELESGLLDLNGFSHIYLIYVFHLSEGYDLLVKPFLDDREHGVFATRAPRRPNPIGLSIVRLVSIDNNIITFSGADIIDGTPLLDIKPYMKQFDTVEQPASGWLKASSEKIVSTRSDRRFSP